MRFTIIAIAGFIIGIILDNIFNKYQQKSREEGYLNSDEYLCNLDKVRKFGKHLRKLREEYESEEQIMTDKDEHIDRAIKTLNECKTNDDIWILISGSPTYVNVSKGAGSLSMALFGLMESAKMALFKRAHDEQS